jgi:nucleoside-diphosphate-sugar epimerase
MQRRAPLFACPTLLLLAIARLFGKASAAGRLLGSLQVDIAATCNTLDWHPPITFDAGIAVTVDSFQRSASK